MTTIPVTLADAPIQTRAAVYFLDSGDYLFSRYDGTEKASKFVTAVDVAAAFSLGEQDTGWLPSGVVRTGRCARGLWYVYTARPKQVEIQIQSIPPRLLKVPVPRTVMVSVGSDTYLWALKSNEFDPRYRPMHAPFPNLYDDGRVCWGENARPEAISVENAQKTWQSFFSTGFNLDLSNGKSRKHGSNVLLMLEELAEAKAKTYPADDLVPVNGIDSIGPLIEKVVRQ